MSAMQNDLNSTIDRLAQSHCDKGVRDAAEAGEWPRKLWQALDEVGLTRAMLAEQAGGFGLGFADTMHIVRRCAYHALPVPLAETMLAHRLLAQAGLEPPDGPLTVACGARGANLDLSGSSSARRLSGTAPRVAWGNQCSHVVVAAEHAGRPMIAVVATADAAATVEKNLAGEPRATLAFSQAPVLAAAQLDNAGARLEMDGAMFRSVQIAGALSRALEHAVRYAGERVAFGRPIGKFQAVQQMLAVLAGHVAAASAAADLAVESSPHAPSAFCIAVAKSRAGEAAGRSAEIAHQVHGAMGFTHEHSLHYTTRRLWSWRDEFGNESYWQARLGRMAASAGPDALWSTISAMTSPGAQGAQIAVTSYKEK